MVIGVAGSGKTVVGRLLSERLEIDFLEGDRLQFSNTAEQREIP